MVTTTLCRAKVQGESTHGWEKKRQIGRVLLVEYKIQTLPL
jgi:hypothetical protein